MGIKRPIVQSLIDGLFDYVDRRLKEPRIFDWGLLILCMLNITTAVMLIFNMAKLYRYQQETRERVDVIYKVMTVER